MGKASNICNIALLKNKSITTKTILTINELTKAIVLANFLSSILSTLTLYILIKNFASIPVLSFFLPFLLNTTNTKYIRYTNRKASKNITKFSIISPYTCPT